MSCKRLFSLLMVAFGLFITSNTFAQEQSAPAMEPAATTEAEGGHEAHKEELNITEVVFGHVSDAHEWHFFELGTTPVAIPLPVILYSPTRGLLVFSAHHFEEWHRSGTQMISNSHEGYHLEKEMKEKVIADDGSVVYDFSITKNVVSMMISVILLLWIMLKVAGKYKQSGATKAPTGLQNAVEAVIVFLRDEVAKPNLGHKYARFMPLLLTIFFFIWINNLLGLLPGGANFTGNVAVTFCLSLVSFIVMIVRANKHFWGHLLNPPGVPTGIKFILVPIEIISLFIKPVALTIRLFANILAGHIIIICVISMIFIFGAMSAFAGIGFVPVSIGFGIFMFMLELLVAAIQAFIFTNLTAVFIGSAVEEAHHHEEAGAHH